MNIAVSATIKESWGHVIVDSMSRTFDQQA